MVNETLLRGCLTTSVILFTDLNPILPRLWKDVVTRGGHYGPPLVFWLWGHQMPKNEPWHIFGPKNYLRSHFEHF